MYPSSICGRLFTWKVTKWLAEEKLSTWPIRRGQCFCIGRRGQVAHGPRCQRRGRHEETRTWLGSPCFDSKRRRQHFKERHSASVRPRTVLSEPSTIRANLPSHRAGRKPLPSPPKNCFQGDVFQGFIAQLRRKQRLIRTNTAIHHPSGRPWPSKLDAAGLGDDAASRQHASCLVVLGS